jgi:hypothetical protein
MDDATRKAVLALVEQARIKADALIVVGILPGGAIVHSCDSRITIPDLHGALQDNVDFICQCVAHNRARAAKERSMA